MAGKTQSKEVKFYNLDVIISVGYRVKSIQGTRFRQWATERLNESIVKGFTMDDERLKNLGGGNYWKELLDRTRDCHEKINKKKGLYRFCPWIAHAKTVSQISPSNGTLFKIKV